MQAPWMHLEEAGAQNNVDASEFRTLNRNLNAARIDVSTVNEALRTCVNNWAKDIGAEMLMNGLDYDIAALTAGTKTQRKAARTIEKVSTTK